LLGNLKADGRIALGVVLEHAKAPRCYSDGLGINGPFAGTDQPYRFGHANESLRGRAVHGSLQSPPDNMFTNIAAVWSSEKCIFVCG
jgi:hypothetical protein